MRKFLPFFILFLCAEANILTAQQSMPAFVSRLTATADGATIHLTWKDSPEAVEKYLVYRLNKEITNDTFDQALLLGSVAPNTMSFVDHPPDDTPYFYTVVVEDEKGHPARVFVPFRNKTTTDDHDIHAVGYTRRDGFDWFLIKDSASSAQHGRFKGYWFYRGDYVKLKMLTAIVHRDVVEAVVPSFPDPPSDAVPER